VSYAPDCRNALADRARDALVGAGIIGDVEFKDVTGTELGTNTAILSYTATRCPEGPPSRGEGLRLLVQTALSKVATRLPAAIDSFRASLWYRGLGCDRGAVGYSVTWKRDTGALIVH
jgi:hypothetical protein